MKSEFIKSAFSVKDYPLTNNKEIILMGKSNVGKSSFINALTNRKNLAYISQTPGMTHGLNFYKVDDFIMVDAPGYGYQAKNKGSYESFDDIMSDYFSNRKQLELALLLLDVRREPTKDDISLLKFIQSYHLPIIIVLTKCDKCSNNELFKQKNLISKALNVSIDSLYPTSALNKTGYDKVLNKIKETLK